MKQGIPLASCGVAGLAFSALGKERVGHRGYHKTYGVGFRDKGLGFRV